MKFLPSTVTSTNKEDRITFVRVYVPFPNIYALSASKSNRTKHVAIGGKE